MPAQKLLVPKCPFSERERLKWRQRLDAMQTTLSEDFKELSAEAFVAEKPGSGDPSNVEQPQEIVFAALDDTRQRMELVNKALAKLDGDGAVPFGICELTFEPIERERLELMPWTPLSKAGARLVERQPAFE